MKKIFLALFIVFIVSCETEDNNNNNTVTDIDGNTYPTVTIGDQVWMAKNLNVSRYRNGDPIPQVQDSLEWSNLTTGAWCYYKNNTANGPIYGKLYNWYAVNDPRGLAPEGYHIPSYNEWSIMRVYIGGDTVNFTSQEARKLKEVGTEHWLSNNGATNETGFTALGAGVRGIIGDGSLGGKFLHQLIITIWWSSTAYNNYGAYHFLLDYSEDTMGGDSDPFESGFSVRCIKD